MTRLETGAVWGGAAEEWQQKKEKEQQKRLELEAAIKDIPVLFDTNNFSELKKHLELLEEAQVIYLRIGGKKFRTHEINKLTEKIMKDFSDPDRKQKVQEGAITDEKIMTYLTKMGAIEEKIDQESLQGFSECLFVCIKNLCAKGAQK